MDWYRFLGWLNVVLAAFNASLFLLKWVIKRSSQNKPADVRKKRMKNIQVFSKTHRLTGIALIISGLTHGILALGGSFSWHTGTLLWASILVIFLLYLIGKARLMKKWLLFHRIADICFWGLLILHLTNPWLF